QSPSRFRRGSGRRVRSSSSLSPSRRATAPHRTLYWRSSRDSPPDGHCGGLAEAQFRSRRFMTLGLTGALGKSPRSDVGIVQGLGRTQPRRAHSTPPTKCGGLAAPSTMMTSGVDVVVRGGQVVTASDVFEAAVAIKGDTIVAIGPESLLPPAARVIDAAGKYVLPGLIDCHLHVGPEYDDWTTAPIAAARTGLTTLLPFVVGDEGETVPRALVRLREEAEARSVLDFGFHFILNHEPHILDGIPEAFRLGVTSFKLFMTYKKRGKRMVSDEFIAKTMERLAALGGICQLHCENGDILCYLEDKAIAEGRTAPTDFPPTCPDWTEEEAINRAVLIARLTGCPVYVVHLSTKVGLERIKRAQAEGQKVWTETCPQYLLLTDKEM